MMGPEQKQFEESLRKYVNAFEPPAPRRTAIEWRKFDKTEEGKRHGQRREQAREYFYQQMNEHIAKSVFQLADIHKKQTEPTKEGWTNKVCPACGRNLYHRENGLWWCPGFACINNVGDGRT